MKPTFSYIAEFRGGVYSSQVESKDIIESIQFWFEKISDQKAEIKFLGDKTLDEIAKVIECKDYQPVKLKGLKNIWFMHIPTTSGAFHINIVKTDIS